MPRQSGTQEGERWEVRPRYWNLRRVPASANTARAVTP